MEGLQVEHSVETWQGIAARLRSGRVRFSTGHQYRVADMLADYIDSAVAGREGLVALDLDWDAALSVMQAG